mmetsp:Transcript_128481/g.304931  ORF Transcript_128481/g.304931 Transcript_128481/m.304931 type:complete len:299 (+) Transcript_128481:2026-2922(+)
MPGVSGHAEPATGAEGHLPTCGLAELLGGVRPGAVRRAGHIPGDHAEAAAEPGELPGALLQLRGGAAKRLRLVRSRGLHGALPRHGAHGDGRAGQAAASLCLQAVQCHCDLHRPDASAGVYTAGRGVHRDLPQELLRRGEFQIAALTSSWADPGRQHGRLERRAHLRRQLSPRPAGHQPEPPARSRRLLPFDQREGCAGPSLHQRQCGQHAGQHSASIHEHLPSAEGFLARQEADVAFYGHARRVLLHQRTEGRSQQERDRSGVLRAGRGVLLRRLHPPAHAGAGPAPPHFGLQLPAN